MWWASRSRKKLGGFGFFWDLTKYKKILEYNPFLRAIGEEEEESTEDPSTKLNSGFMLARAEARLLFAEVASAVASPPLSPPVPAIS